MKKFVLSAGSSWRGWSSWCCWTQSEFPLIMCIIRVHRTKVCCWFHTCNPFVLSLLSYSLYALLLFLSNISLSYYRANVVSLVREVVQEPRVFRDLVDFLEHQAAMDPRSVDDSD